MKRFLALFLALAMALTLTACKSKKKKNDQESGGFGFLGGQSSRETETPQDATEPPTEMEIPAETLPPEPETEPTEPEPVETELTEPPTEAPTEETEPPEDPEEVLLDVLVDLRTLRTPNGESMYLWQLIAKNHGSEVLWWEFVDMDQDRINEIIVEIDSKAEAYVVLHWDGKDVYAYTLGFRDISELKTNGAIAGSQGAAHTIYYRLEFRKNGYRQYILADLDFDAGIFQIEGRSVSEDRARAFLEDWEDLSNIIGATYIPPEEEACAWCGRVTDDLITQLCDDCYWYVGWCSWCGQLATEIYDGVCTDCRPYEGYDRYCDICGDDCMGEEMIDGLCLDCWYALYG